MKAGLRINRALLVAALWAVAGAASAQGPGHWQGPGHGPGMGPGMMGGYGGGPGYGPAPGMRHAPGYGPQGLGPGAGMGPGMMQGRGAGAMRGRWERMAHALGLSEDQRAKVGRIMEDTRRKDWDVLGQIQSERFKLREMVRGDKVDPDAAVEQKRKLDDLRRQVMRSRLEARNQVLALLTPEQREKARAFGPQRWSGRGNG